MTEADKSHSPSVDSQATDVKKAHEVKSAHEQTISTIEKAHYREKRAKRNLLRSIIISGLLLGIILFFALYRLQYIYELPFLNTSWFSSSRKTIRIIPTKDQNLILLISNRGKGEVRLINPVTRSAQDISLGDENVTAASLSPNGNMVAYASTNSLGSSLFLFTISDKDLSQVAIPIASPSTTKTPVPIPKPAATASSNPTEGKDPNTLIFSSTSFKVCEWSGLYWSTKGDKLAFFGCDEKGSSVYIVSTSDQIPTEKNKEPSPIESTVSITKYPRDMTWLKNGNLVFTTGNKQIDSLRFLIDPKPNEDKESQRLYGVQDLDRER